MDGLSGWLGGNSCTHLQLAWTCGIRVAGDSEGSGKTVDATTVAVAGAAGGSLLVFSQLPQLLELVGIAFVLQFGVRRLLFAESRKKTLAELEGIQKRISAGVPAQQGCVQYAVCWRAACGGHWAAWTGAI